MSLVIENVSKFFVTKHKTTHTLENINLEISNGEFVCLVGPSGCGKSTMLNIVAGLENATAGRVLSDGKQLNGPGQDRVLMFQESALFPWLRVLENVESGMVFGGIPKAERRVKALKYLDMVNLTKFKDSFIHELSGGMKQRVALARALALDSEILLMDEPFAALDAQTKNFLQMELQRIWMETRKTIIFVTHNIEEAVLLADRVIVMSANPGKIKAVFEIQLERPRYNENDEIASTIARIRKELNWEEKGIVRHESEIERSIQKDLVLSDTNTHMGVSI